jgi:hypothetical protein
MQQTHRGYTHFTYRWVCRGRHRIGALAADAHTALAGPVGVAGELAVLINHRHQPLGGHPQFFGFEPAADRDQLGLGLRAGVGVHPAGQVRDEPADDAHVFGVEPPAGLGGRQPRQHRFERLADECRARAQLLGVGQPPACLARRDAQPGGQHLGSGFGPELVGCAAPLQLTQQPVLQGGLTTAQGFQPVAHRLQFGRAQRVQRQPAGPR